MDPNQLAETLLAQAAEAAARARLPESTYRLQFHAGFTFRDATAIVPYLRDLGITHCYASPYLKARPGSTHGYDIIDHGCAQPGDRHRRRTTRPGSPPCASTAWVRSSTPCPTTWGSAPTRTPGGTTCWRTARPRATAPTSTSPGGRRPGPSSRTRSCCRSWATPTATSSRPASSGWPSPTGRSSIHYGDRRFPVGPAQLRQDPRAPARRAGARAWAPRTPRFVEFQSILTAVRNLPEQHRDRARQGRRAPAREGGDQAPAGGAGRRERAGARSSSSRTWPRSTAGRATRGASTCWTTCSSTSATAWPTGGWPPTRSTTAGSSTSTTWPR